MNSSWILILYHKKNDILCTKISNLIQLKILLCDKFRLILTKYTTYTKFMFLFFSTKPDINYV